MKNYITFTHPYVLIEDSKNKYQPMYKEYTTDIPTIDFKSPPLCCPFSTARRTNMKKKINVSKPGYCEICFIKYEDYEIHINSNDHREYAEDDNNYKKIDLFINELDSNQNELYLEIPKSPCDYLEAKLALSLSKIDQEIDINEDSLIRFSKESSGSYCDENIHFDVVMENIDKKFSQDK